MRKIIEKGFGSFDYEPLTIDLIKKGLDRDDTSYTECHNFLKDYGYKDYGWLNAGNVKLPTCNFEKVYSNRSGSSCLYGNHEFMVMYSVDMGD